MSKAQDTETIYSYRLILMSTQTGRKGSTDKPVYTAVVTTHVSTSKYKTPIHVCIN